MVNSEVTAVKQLLGTAITVASEHRKPFGFTRESYIVVENARHSFQIVSNRN